MRTQIQHEDRLWTIDDVAAFLSVPVATLYRWRHHGTGPQARRIGRYLRYVPSEVQTWVVEQV